MPLECFNGNPCASCRMHQFLWEKLGEIHYGVYRELAKEAAETYGTTTIDGSVPPEIDLKETWESRHLHCSVRLSKAIKASGCRTFGQICALSRKEWLEQKDFGKKSLRELEEILVGAFGLYLRGVNLYEPPTEHVFKY